MKIFPFFPDKFIKKGAHKTKAKSCRCQAFTLPNRVLDQLDWKRTTCTRSEAYDYVAAAEGLEPFHWPLSRLEFLGGISILAKNR